MFISKINTREKQSNLNKAKTDENIIHNTTMYTQCLYFVLHYNFTENNEIDLKYPFIVFVKTYFTKKNPFNFTLLNNSSFNNISDQRRFMSLPFDCLLK